jgi:hypothetical protein
LGLDLGCSAGLFASTVATLTDFNEKYFRINVFWLKSVIVAFTAAFNMART